MELVSTLSEPEQSELARCEDAIRRGWKNFVEVGEALLKIQEGRLYRDHYHSFEHYYQAVWQYQKSQVYRLMDAAKVVRVLSPIGEESDEALPTPTCEAQVRPLAYLNESEIKTVWQQATARAQAINQPISARLVQSEVRLSISSDELKRREREGKPVRQHRIANRTDRITEQLNRLLAMISIEKRRSEAKDVINYIIALL